MMNVPIQYTGVCLQCMSWIEQSTAVKQCLSGRHWQISVSAVWRCRNVLMNSIGAYTSHTDSVLSFLSGLKPKIGMFLFLSQIRYRLLSYWLTLRIVVLFNCIAWLVSLIMLLVKSEQAEISLLLKRILILLLTLLFLILYFCRTFYK